MQEILRGRRERNGNGNIVLLPFKTLPEYSSHRREKEKERYISRKIGNRLSHILYNIEK